MPDGQTSLLAKLIIIGAAIGLGRLMVSRDRITARLLIGRMIMGLCRGTGCRHSAV